MRFWIAVALTVWAASSPALAASMGDPICADRPGKSSATCVVPKGSWQVETGLADWSLTKVGGARETELAIAASAIKYGLTERLTVELDVAPYVRITSRSAAGRERASGVGDIAIAAKYAVPTSGALSVAIYPYAKLPTAAGGVGNGKVEGGLRIPLGLALGSSPFSLSTTPQVDFAADGDGHGYHAAMTQVAGLGWAASDSLSFSAELWGQWDWDPAGTSRQYGTAASAAYLAGQNVQLDGGVEFGLSRASPDVSISGGVSIRF